MKNILLTGVSRGLGLNIAKLLLENDYAIWGLSRNNTNELQSLMDKFKSQIRVKFIDLSQVDKIKDVIFKDFIKFDTPLFGFVNNAAYAYDDIITNANYEKLKYSFDVNFFSSVLLIKHTIRNMLLHKIKGSLVHISSISVHTGYKGLSMYAASKGALEALSKNVAREWGERGIRSNCIVAGFMETDMNSKLTPEQKDRIYQRTSLKSPTTLDSVANTVLFLLDDKSKSITGQNIFVDSGTI